MKKLVSFLSKTIVLFQLTIGQSYLYAGLTDGTPDASIRTEDRIKEIMQSASPSDIPFVEYVESLKPETTQPIKKMDLSPYKGKKVYVGYGIYDQDNKFCKYVELPTKPDPAPELVFRDIKIFNGKTYALVRDTSSQAKQMTYDECKDIAIKYGGIVASPVNVAENAFIASYGVENWLGIERPSCTDKYYNMKGDYQYYTNWSVSEKEGVCEDSKLNVVQYSTGTWKKVNQDELYNCIMEMDSPDINRPIKICAPWWRIERTYNQKPRTNVYGFNLATINQADVPKLFNICTQYDEEGQEDANSTALQQYTCTTYYDATVAPECLRNPYQPQCFVSECKGYVENVCTHTKEIVPYKDYTKIQIQTEGGDRKTVYGKVHIRTQVYMCPAVTPSSQNCLEKSTVIAYPKECPGSQCDARKECYANGKDSDDFFACNEQYPCEKIYPSIDFTPTVDDMDDDGNVKTMHGKCSDGTILDFPVNIQNKLNKTCVEWAVYTETKQIKKTCILDRGYEDFVVDMSITDVDAYQDDPNCVRTNNIEEARADGTAIFDVYFNGFIKNKIYKAFIDGTQEQLLETGSGEYLEKAALVHLEDTIYEDEGKVDTEQDPDDGGLTSCPLADSGSEDEVNKWGEEKLAPLINSGVGAYQELSGSTVFAYPVVMDNDGCNTFAAQVGGTVVGYTPCKVKRSATDQDKIFHLIKRTGGSIDDPVIRFESENTSYTDEECSDWGDCVDADGSIDSSTKRCVAESASDAEEDHVQRSDLSVVNCKPGTSSDSKVSEYNGVSEIYIVTDQLDGSFGYTSNYLNHALEDNKVLVNGKEVFPINPTARIIDPIDYISKIKQVSITTKKPNYVAGAIGGAGAGASYSLLVETISVPVLGLVIVVAFVIFALLFAKKQKLNEESIYWLVYKDVLKTEYIDNVYGYDTRWKTDNGDYWRMIYLYAGDDPGTGTAGNCWGHGGKSYWRNFTGTLKTGDFKDMLANMFLRKQQDFACFGIDPTLTPYVIAEKSVVVDYPKCKWYQFNCDKENHECFSQETEIRKTMNGYYIGGTQTLSIVTPFIGDYEIEAYDAGGELLASTTVYADEFVDETPDTHANAQVNFGLKMGLADGIEEGALDKACREVSMVEWGGGVSGIYFENKESDIITRSECQKSNDNYVADHSMTKLRIRPTNQKNWYVFNLEKPMPYPNRIRLVSLNEKEIREYRCYFEFGECDEDSFTEGGD